MLKLTKNAGLAMLIASLALPQTALAKSSNGEVSTPPANMRVLGPQTYITMDLKQLAKPSAVFVDKELAREAGYESAAEILKDYGYAGQMYSEAPETYTDKTKAFYVGGYGGIGMHTNLGDGRSVIAGAFRIKGGAKTPKAMMKRHHGDGSSILHEAILESIAGRLLDFELPYGAMKTLAIVLPNSMIGKQSEHERALIVSEDPLRYAHYIYNFAARRLGGEYQKEDEARIKAAFANIEKALPLPEDFDVRGKTRAEIFLAGLNETVDRQAIQLGYAWAHKMYHGATSPSNMTLDGRMVDFGTLKFMPGYLRLQTLTDDGPSGDSHVFVRDQWAHFWWTLNKNLSPELRQVLPTRQKFYERFTSRFEKTKRDELVRMAGLMNEYSAILAGTPAEELGKILFEIATAGHTEVYGLWEKDGAKVAEIEGTYNLGRVLGALAMAGDDIHSMNQALKGELVDQNLRSRLVQAYHAVIQQQSELARKDGISDMAEQRYRIYAAAMRNKPMDLLFEGKAVDARVEAVKEAFTKTRDGKVVQNFIDDIVNRSRREFRDAEPFTVVLSEYKKAGKTMRSVFDARANSFKEIEFKEQSKTCDLILKAAARGA